MSDREVLLARARGYELFAEIFLNGVTESLMPVVALVADLQDSMDSQATNDSSADHYDLFGMNVQPFESIFRDESMILGGQVADAVIAFYEQIGFKPPSSDNGDHLGVELYALAYLCRAELNAEKSGETDEAKRAQDLQLRLLEEHILLWLPMLSNAVTTQNKPFYTILCDLTLALALDHRNSLSQADLNDINLPSQQDAPVLLDDMDTGMKEIAIFLLTPAMSGVFISKAEIGDIGRKYEIPRGFGNRVQTLTNLLRAAAGFDSLPAVLADVLEILASWAAYYSDLAERHALIRPLVEGYLARVSRSQAMIARMIEASSKVPIDE